MTTAIKQAKAKILEVRIEHKFDESPDTSHLGEYSSKIPSHGFYLDREKGELIDAETGAVVADNLPSEWERNTHEYICGFQHCGTEGWSHVSDKGVTNGYLSCRYRRNGKGKGNLFVEHGVKGWDQATTREQKIRLLNIVYCCEDACRLEDLNNGEWQMIGVIAKAEVVSSTGTVQVIRSGGLWGVESDAGEYLKEIESEQLEELRDELESFGFGKRAIDYAFKNVKRD